MFLRCLGTFLSTYSYEGKRGEQVGCTSQKTDKWFLPLAVYNMVYI